jgi:pimeloyl-ACP methyl ester carboxylesterase
MQMNGEFLRIVALAALGAAVARADNSAAPNAVTTQFVEVGKGVRLEVLDWGGTGRSVILLANLGGTAHVFNAFAPKLARRYHVFGITRRGFGASTAPASGYSADQLGDDVLAVIEALRINRPVLLGHSMSGEELSSIGSRHPEKISGLIYLEAAYPFAFYDPSVGDMRVDGDELRERIDLLITERGVSDVRPLIAEILSSLPRFENDLTVVQRQMEGIPEAAKGAAPPPDDPLPVQEIVLGQQKYTSVGAPVLAIFSYPHAVRAGKFRNDPAGLAEAEARDLAIVDAQIKTVERDDPSARIVRIPHSAHRIYSSNEADILREVDAFIGGLPGP